MKLTLKYDIKPLTVNQAFRSFARGKRVQTIKSEKYRLFEQVVAEANKENQELFKQFNANYNSEQHYLEVAYRFYMPVITKANKINKRGGDVDNLLKPIKDCIFKELVADDSEVITLSATKIEADLPRIVVEIIRRDLAPLL